MNDSVIESVNSTALVVMRDVIAVKQDEKVLIITNPEDNVFTISRALYTATEKLGGKPILIIQPVKTLLDYAEKSVVGAISTEPDVILSISQNKLGKDEAGMTHPYTYKGKEYTSMFDLLLGGKKCTRSFWTPGITTDMFLRTANIDYKQLQKRCAVLCEKFKNAVSVHVTAPGGTDIKIPVNGRSPFSDDGCFSTGGAGGNIPAGEVFISPVVGGSEGRIVFDGSMSITGGDIAIKEPIICDVANGFVTAVYNAVSGPSSPAPQESEAGKLLASITGSEQKARKMAQDGIFSKEKAASYERNSRGIGELGIGLNPAAKITGNMLEDEKAFHTCHFAIGENYDGDGDTFIHLDGVVRNPTIVINYADGTSFTVEKDGELSPELQNI
ncbi:MAG: peptidase M17 [Spirochaetaceae bacterium]|nr:peptidase M17 [Spirochaetaceae bacterium]